jgi:hypothetical protein
MNSQISGTRMKRLRRLHKMIRLMRRTGSLSNLRKQSLGLSSTVEAGIFNRF